MTFEAFKEFVDGHPPVRNWRRGQTAFNLLYQERPGIADAVRGGPLDPFHVDDRMDDFWTFVAEHWDDPAA